MGVSLFLSDLPTQEQVVVITSFRPDVQIIPIVILASLVVGLWVLFTCPAGHLWAPRLIILVPLLCGAIFFAGFLFPSLPEIRLSAVSPTSRHPPHPTVDDSRALMRSRNRHDIRQAPILNPPPPERTDAVLTPLQLCR